MKREAGVPPLLHATHSEQQPSKTAETLPQEVLHEKGLHVEREIVIKRDQEGRMIKRTTRELRLKTKLLSGEDRWKDLTPYAPSPFPMGGSFGDIKEYILDAPPITAIRQTTEEFEYVPDSDQVARIVETDFLDIAPERPSVIRTTEFDYTPDGQVQERRVQFKLFSVGKPLTYASRVTKWEAGKPAELAIVDARSGEETVHSRWTMKYDKQGRSIEETEFEGEGEQERLSSKYALSYDDKNRLTQVRMDTPKGGYSHTWLYEYADLPEDKRTVTRRTINDEGDEESGERITFGRKGEKVRQESWLNRPDLLMGDTSWVTQS